MRSALGRRRADEAQRRTDALAILLDIAGEQPAMPRVRGSLPHLVIISEGGRSAHTVGGTALSNGQFEGIACMAEVTRVTVDADRQPLNVGRSARSVGRRQWLALLVRDGGHCQVAGCRQPGSRCEPHHVVPWALGGSTDLDNLVLVCVQHHHALHDRMINLKLTDGRVVTPSGPAAVAGVGPPAAVAA